MADEKIGRHRAPKETPASANGFYTPRHLAKRVQVTATGGAHLVADR